MQVTDFSHSNTVFAKDQAEYHQLPAYRFKDDPQGCIAFCWSLSWADRLRLLLTGKVWQQTLTFNHALQPQLLTTKKPAMP